MQASKKQIPPVEPTDRRDVAQIVFDMGQTGFELVKAEAELLRTDIMQAMTAEMLFTRRLIIGSTLMMIGVCMLLVALVFVLSKVVSPCIVAVLFGVTLIGMGLTTSVLAWRHHKTLSQIRVELEADIWSLLHNGNGQS